VNCLGRIEHKDWKMEVKNGKTWTKYDQARAVGRLQYSFIRVGSRDERTIGNRSQSVE
jgi:hypothetical protein